MVPQRKFKTFETIAKFRKLYEAAEDEQPAENILPAEGEQPVEQPVDAAAPPQDDTADPSQQADPESGTFMSDNQKAELAKMMLDALMMTPPEPGTIPSNLLNVTTNNADEVIKYIQGLNALSSPLSLENDVDSNSMAGALKNT